MRARTGIVAGPLPADLLSPVALACPEHGAVASFIGVVRNHHHGRGVTHLVYDCYQAMAERMLAALVAEAAERFDAHLQAQVHHGTGRMDPGQVAVAIHVACAHREAAFAACRHLIERIKEDLPVWKQEFYADGTALWLKGS
jgi:molybdopterin synthase catalytic subunit